MTMYELPDPPLTGLGVDARGITWRRNGEGLWDPDPCPTCGTCWAGGLTWSALLARGPVNDAAPTGVA